MILKILLPILLLASDDVVLVSAFLRAAPSSPSTTTTATRRPHHNHHYRRHHWIVAAPSHASTTDDDEDIGGSLSESGSGGGRRRGDNAAMSFLRKMGRVGGAANMDFANALGLDESPSGGTKTAHHEGGFKNVRKSKASYVPCAISGIIDDMSDPFPFTSSGSQWQGITDRVMGGSSNGSLSREIVDGRIANVLRGTVSLENGGGFVQMATDLSSDPSGAEGVFVDASGYDGVELDVYCEGMEDDEERFNVHLRTPACERQNSSYRYTFAIVPGRWTPMRVPWSAFEGHGPGPDVTPFVPSLRRLGVVSIGEAKEVVLAVGKVGFYNVI